jgi:hypothetical protein
MNRTRKLVYIVQDTWHFMLCTSFLFGLYGALLYDTRRLYHFTYFAWTTIVFYVIIISSQYLKWYMLNDDGDLY